MKMQMWIYQTKSTPVKGFCIQEHNKGTNYTIWCDSEEGGYAHDNDWEFCGSNEDYQGYPNGELKTFDEAYNWIVDNYGELVDIDEND
jgi:hypothetical protein